MKTCIVGVFALLVAVGINAAAYWHFTGSSDSASVLDAAPESDLVDMEPSLPPKADATVRVVLPAEPRVCAPGAAPAYAVVRARVYVEGEKVDREMDVMLLPGTWTAP